MSVVPFGNMFGKIREQFIRLLVYLATPLDDDRTAIWSIPKPLEVAYFVTFTGVSVWTIAEIVQVRMAAYCGFVWTVAAAASRSDCVTTWNALVRETAAEFAPIGVGIGISTLAAIYGVAALMAIYQILTNAFTKPIIERHVARGRTAGHEEGRREGREQGRVEGREQGRKEGREQGIEEGRAEGMELAGRAWREWNARRIEAEANGLPFDEPMPDET